MLGTTQVEVKDKEERKLKKVKIALMRNPQFRWWSSIMMVGTTSVVDDIPTACTNGRDEAYGRKFIEMLDEKELAFVVMHENMHKAYKHLTTWTKLHDINPKLTNMACDYVINLQLKDLDPNEQYIAMPQHGGKAVGLVDEKYRGMNTKQVFDELRKELGDNYGEDEGEGGGGGLDDHDWKGAKELSAEDKKLLEREIDQAIRSGQIGDKSIGNGGGGMNRDLEEMLEPTVDWREQMRDFVKSICNAKDTSSWRRLNRRFLHEDICMPTLIGEKVGHIAIGIDTSGSQGSREISQCLGEVKGIVEEVSPQKIDLIYWDSEVANHEQYEGSAITNIASQTKPKGGGGTDPTCMADHMKEQRIKPECIVMLTDGYIGSWGNDEDWQGVPILWAIVGGNKSYAPIGKTIHIKDIG